MSKEIIEMADDRVLSLPVIESNDPLVDLRKATSILVGPPPEYPETAPHYTFVRKGLVERIKLVQSKFTNGQFLRLYEGYRTPKIQNMIFQRQHKIVAENNPEWSPKRCHDEASKLAAPLTTFEGMRNIPPHSTGGAVDLEIVNSDGKVIDFGMEVKDMSYVAPELCATDFKDVSQEAIDNRAQLLEACESAEFVNYPREWWHFSYGDRYWAYAVGESAAHYDQVDD